MAREHLLCLASGTDTRGNLRSFTVYKVRGLTFVIHNDRGHKHVSHPSRRVTERDIKAEIGVVYHVANIRLEGNFQEAVLASTWPASCNQCLSCGCGPTRRAYGRQSYCGLCYSMVEAIAALTAWDRAKSASFHHVPKSAQSDSVTSYFSEQEFEIWRADHIRQAKRRLEWLRSREQKRRGEIAVDGADLEQKFATLLHAVRRKAKLSSKAKCLIGIFDEEQRHALYTLLDEIEEQIPWRGFSSQVAYDLIHKPPYSTPG
ncbi:MAG: hypothetical protein ABSC37_16130 [Xanthobacteraceae bacterium]